MTTTSEYAKSATAALHQVLRTSPGDFDSDHAAAVIERAITKATRERQTRARRQLKAVEAAAQERLARLLNSSPAVIYSFKAACARQPRSGILRPVPTLRPDRADFGYWFHRFAYFVPDPRRGWKRPGAALGPLPIAACSDRQ